MIPKKSTLESSSNFTIPTSIAVNLEPYALSHPSRPVNKWFWITYYFQVESNWVTQLDPSIWQHPKTFFVVTKI